MQHDRQLIRREQEPSPRFFKEQLQRILRPTKHLLLLPKLTTLNATPTTTATIPYIMGISENISRILQPLNIRFAHKPITTLRQLLTNDKDKDEPRNRQGADYTINCSDCHASYLGETGRKFTITLTEQKRATRKDDINSHIAKHHRLKNHTIDWDSAHCLTYSTYF